MNGKNIILAFVLIITVVVVGVWVQSDRSPEGWVLTALSKVKEISGKSSQFEPLSDFTSPPDHSLWDSVLTMHVDSHGLFDYVGLIQNTDDFEVYILKLSSNPPSRDWSRNEQLAYWINAYNAFTVKIIIDHWPVQSIKDIAGNTPMINSVWDLKFFNIGNQPFDLNTIEHDILRKQLSEPLIHFAINCASISCPVLRNEAYSASNLDMQLQQQTRLFLKDKSKNVIDESTLAISPIFKWFQEDFGGRDGVREFISRYADHIPGSTSIQYTDYDWRLNQSN